MKVLIVDNEKNIRQSFRVLLEKLCPEIQEIREAEGVESALNVLNAYSPDIVLLDVEMDDGTGFDLMQKVTDSQLFELIFITAHNKYAINAFEFSAIDYLLKPVDPFKFKNAIDKAIANVQRNDYKTQIDFLLNELNGQHQRDKRIALRDTANIHYVRVSDISYCEAKGNYTQFYIEGESDILVSKILKEYEKLLEPLGFIRTHNSYLVNPKKIKKYDKEDGGVLVLQNGKQVPLSQRKKESVLSLLESL